ncbi:MAG: cyclic nucleotide-binding domain-containing protein [Chloroflexi bacterium]|nr:cyclic nucleotide-binding domain-containing protein [Chloroflexota bacterium]
MKAESLRRSLFFDGLPEEDLNWLLSKTEEVSVQAGTLLMEEGTPGDALYLVLDGEFEITKRSGGQEVVLAARGPSELLGELALLEQAPRSASVRALKDGRLLKIGGADFQKLLSSSPSAALAILHTVTSRLRNTESMLRQHEKMAALGTLAAGVAHELNNPAAAVRRSSAQLREILGRYQRLDTELSSLAVSLSQREVLSSVSEALMKGESPEWRLDPLTRSDQEGNLQSWLEEMGVDQAWELAPPLVSFGLSAEKLGNLSRDFSPEQFHSMVQWIGARCSAYALLKEIGEGAERISEIVKAVKSYSYLDQAPIQEIDVHDGLENTLVLLRHKIKHGVHVIRQYAPDLPHIEAYASELNQVWTNIIDNALDAMEEQGELILRTFGQKGQITVEICDTGPGIPIEIQPRIFDPFFTTKPPGVGTGLGLHISYNIVVHKHHGEIKVASRPGGTCFQVTLPEQMMRDQHP